MGEEDNPEIIDVAFVIESEGKSDEEFFNMLDNLIYKKWATKVAIDDNISHTSQN